MFPDTVRRSKLLGSSDTARADNRVISVISQALGQQILHL
jgi:hypothetical protein